MVGRIRRQSPSGNAPSATKSGFTAAFLRVANQMCQTMAKVNETTEFIFSAARGFYGAGRQQGIYQQFPTN
ncbi:TPA: hypothetical protein M4K80_000762 [Salmonella enterica]|nr:hypothetical protein [Salmonella enterica]